MKYVSNFRGRGLKIIGLRYKSYLFVFGIRWKDGGSGAMLRITIKKLSDLLKDKFEDKFALINYILYVLADAF